MKTVTINVYQFNELSPIAQSNAIESLGKINVADGWDKDILKEIVALGALNVTYELLTESYCNIDFAEPDNNNMPVKIPLYNEIAKYIIENHDKTTKSYLVTKAFLDAANHIAKTSDKFVDLEIETLEQTFKEMLESHYFIVLKEEYNLRTSEKEVIKTLQTHKFEFTINGRLYEAVPNQKVAHSLDVFVDHTLTVSNETGILGMLQKGFDFDIRLYELLTLRLHADVKVVLPPEELLREINALFKDEFKYNLDVIVKGEAQTLSLTKLPFC